MGESERGAGQTEITHVIRLPTCDQRAEARDALAMQRRDYRLIVEGELSDAAVQGRSDRSRPAGVQRESDRS